MKPPRAEQRPVDITQHGYVRTDNYSWLRDKNWKKFIKGDLDFSDIKVKEYLDEEARFTEKNMASTKDLQSTIYNELLSRTKEDDESYPYQKNDFFYYSKTVKGLSYPILCRKNGSIEAPEEIYFDINKEAEGHKLYMHRFTSSNDSNSLFAYSYNLTGSMENTLKVRDFKTKKTFNWTLENLSHSFLWIDDNTILFAENDEFSRGKKVFTMNVKEGLKSKSLIFEKPEEHNNRFLGVGRTKDRKTLFIYLTSGSSEVIYKKEESDNEFILLFETTNDIEYSIEHSGESYFILTNDFGNPNFAIYSCNENDLADNSKWNCIVKNNETRYLRSLTCYGDKLVVEAKNIERAIEELLVFNITSRELKSVEFTDEIRNIGLIGAHDFNSSEVQVRYGTPIQPYQTLNLNLATGNLKVLKTKEIPNFNRGNYILKREFAKTSDGELVPLTIIHSKDLKKGNSDNKAFVYAYGSYGYAMPSAFVSSLFSLVDRGFTYVLAHIRGGSDKGQKWYLDGKMKKKMNTFNDYISACEHLINEDYVEKGNIVANGGSAGGLLMGAVVNMRPDLFRAVIADVPFVDVINTISDATLPLTPPEWEEWGNPIENKSDYEYMMKYSPYDNVEAKSYPKMLFNSGISDEQVTYWEPAKMVAKLRELKTDDNLLLLNIKMHAGHAGETDRYEGLRDKAFNFSFALDSFLS